MEVLVSDTGVSPAIVTVRGQLDIDTAPELRATFDDLRAGAVKRIAADLTELDFCDSIGLSTLVVTHHYCVDAGGWLHLAGPTPFLTRLLAVVGVAGTVPIYRSLRGALTGDQADLVQIAA